MLNARARIKPLRTRRSLWLILCAFLHSLTFTVSAAPPRHPRIPSYERFYAVKNTDLRQAGNLLLGELNCLRCHSARPNQERTILTKQAPVLDEVGHRVRPDYLRAFLNDPQQTKPGTTMPNLFANVEKSKRQQQIEALVHFLTSTGNLTEVAPATSAINRGKGLFRSVGCLACHDEVENQSTGLTTSVPLGDLARKYSIPGLATFLDDPLRIRPSGRMPKLTLNNEEAQHIASYLLKDIQIEPFCSSAITREIGRNCRTSVNWNQRHRVKRSTST